MNILKIWDSEYPWDVRVEKVSETLIKHGHKISLVCRNRKNQPAQEDKDGLKIIRLPYLTKLPACNSALSFPAFFNPLWISTILSTAQKSGADLLLVRDLPMALGAIFVGKWMKIPVVLDMAEPYPEMLRLIFRFQKWRWRNLLLRNPILADGVERLTLRLIDHVIVVVEESKERLIEFGIPHEKITVITNATVFADDEGLLLPEAYADAAQTLKIVYLGLLGESRGLQTAIEAMPDIIRQVPGARLYILGAGSAESLLQSMVKDKNLEKMVHFLGWVNNERARAFIKHADIAIIPHFSCGHWDHTIPNKLFDYMAYGVPVVASDVPPMKRIIEEEDCGVIFRSGDWKDCARAVTILKDKTLRHKLGMRGKAAVMAKYQWQHSEARLAETLEKVCKNAHSIH